MTAVEVLERAIEEKKTHPHIQFRFIDDYSGGICMWEALARGAGGNSATIHYSIPPVLYEALAALELTPGSVCQFNNEHTKEECVAKFEEARAKLVTA